MRALISFLLAVTAVNGALLGSKKCTWGPSYWCESFQQADECGATQHCHDNVWTRKEQPQSSLEVDTDACTFCKDMVSDVKNFLESNQTQATILQYMNRACDFLPDEYSLQECKKIEQHYLDQFEKCVNDNIDADTICGLCRLCGNNTRSPQKDPVKPPTVQAAKLTRVSLKSSALSLRTKAKDDQLCEACKSFMAMASTEVKDPKNQAAIKTMLLNECKQLGGDLDAECEAAVTTYLPQAFDMIEQELTDQLCTTLGLCNATDALSVAMSAAAAKSRVQAALRSDTIKTAFTSAASHLNSDACTTCEEIAGYAKIFLSNNATEQQVQQMLETEVCPKLGEFSDMCKTLVEEYIPQLYSLLLKELDPATICSDLGLCTKAAAPSPVIAKAPVSNKIRARASVQCIACEFIISKLEDTLSDNATEEEIIHAVEKICTIMPSTVRDECTQVIEKYGDAIIKLLVNGASPATLCTFLGLCSSGGSMYKLPMRVGDESCEVCQMAITYVQSLLEKNSTQQQVIHVVEKVCNFLSGDMASQCNTMIDQYGPAIISLLVDDIAPESLCSTLGLCPTKEETPRVDGLVHLMRSDNY